LTLVLGAGRETDASARLAVRVLDAAGGLARLDRIGRIDADACAGFWPRRAALVRAAIELGRRAQALPLGIGTPVRDAESVWAHFRGRLPQLDREAFYVLLLDGKNRVQAEVRVSEGSLTARSSPQPSAKAPPPSSSSTTTPAATPRLRQRTSH
jgi:DNA repair protein RadC